MSLMPAAPLSGSGAQLFAMAAATLTFALLGFMSPANRGGLLTSLLLLFVFMGKPESEWRAASDRDPLANPSLSRISKAVAPPTFQGLPRCEPFCSRSRSSFDFDPKLS